MLDTSVRRGARAQSAQRDDYEYYDVTAEHRRVRPIGHKIFEGKLAMVRVTLPTDQPRRIETAIGTIDPSDHLIASLHAANERYRAELGYTLVRVDLIAPARQRLRFGAISVLLGYRDAKRGPCCYILEAGLATGEPRMLYLSKTIAGEIEQATGYSPTPFASPENLYMAGLTVDGEHPKLLRVSARERGPVASQCTYMELTVRFARQRGMPSSKAPGWLLARATVIVIARMLRGVPVRSPETLIPPAWRGWYRGLNERHSK